MTFGNTLRILLEERNITQKKLAEDLNIAASTIGGYVQNSSEPDFDTLKRLANYFNVSTDYLLGIPSEKVNSYNEDELLRVYRTMTFEQQIMFLEQGRAVARLNAREKTKSS